MDAVNASQAIRQPEFQRVTANTHGRLAIPLLSGQAYQWRMQSGTHTIESRSSDRFDKILNPPGEQSELDQANELRKEQIEEGAAPSEFEIPANIPTRRMSPIGSANRALAFRPAGLLPTWARSLLTAEALGVILSWLIKDGSIDDLSLSNLLTLSVVLTQICYGFRPEVILQAKRKTDQPFDQDQGQRLVYERGVFGLAHVTRVASPSLRQSRIGKTCTYLLLR